MKPIRYSDLPKELRIILKKFHATDVHTINISSSFLARSRCKSCGKGPKYYFSVNKPYLYFLVNQRIFTSKAIRKWITNLVTNWYLSLQPKQFKNMKNFKIALNDKHFTPTLHRTRGSDVKDRDNIIDMISCDCGETTWAYNEKSVKNRPEITNRKGKYSFPQKFKF